MSSPATRIATAAGGILLALLLLIAAAASAVLGGTGAAAGNAPPSRTALADIPPGHLALYQRAALTCPGLPWTVLAAVGKVETDHGRDPNQVSPAGALGPMQFMPDTWAAYGTDGNGDGKAEITDTADAVFSAARYLCASGARGGRDLRAALFTYNHSTAYVEKVLAQAAAYAAAPPAGTGAIHTRWLPEQATIPDPTGTGGRITPRMRTLYQALRAAGSAPRVSCWDAHAWNPTSDHPTGRACDIFFNPHDPPAVARGWQLAHWLTTVQATYGIHYLIWQGQSWSAESPTWKPYRSGVYGCPNPANLTGCHYDHIHISVY